MLVSNVKIGADPEMFLIKSGKFFASCGLLGGSKVNPRPIDEDGSCIQEDNVAVEFNIKPSVSKEEFISNISKVYHFIEREVKEKYDLDLAVVSSAEFEKDQLESKQALIFGCDPDFNAYTMQANPRPRAKNKFLRSAGGHIHIGYDSPTLETNIKLVKSMDLFLGLPSILIDEDYRRRELYGKAGAFRFKPYGVEYRTASNFWIKDEVFIGFAYDQTMKAIDFVNSGGEFNKELEEKIQEGINTSNVPLVETLISQFGVL